MSKDLRVHPITLTDARGYVERHHSHLHAPVGGLFAVSVQRGGVTVCIAIVSRPIARVMQNGTTCEVTRCASDGTAMHAASMAYGACVRVAMAQGYRRVLSSTILGEAGTCLRAAGFKPVAVSGTAENWHSRPGRTVVQNGSKVRWEAGPDAAWMVAGRTADRASQERFAEVDALVRASVGQVAIPERPETLPLLARLTEGAKP